MRKVLGIVRYTCIEIFRNKVYYVLVLFAIVLIGASLLLGELGGEQRNRMIIDFGMVAMEWLTLLIAIFAAVTLVMDEMETRTLYLILSRPVARYQFVLGRFLGLVTILTATFFVMALGHLLLPSAMKIHPDTWYTLSLFFSWEKIVLITAIGMAFSLFATSTVSALAFTFFFWILGHFTSEMRYLAVKTSRPVLKVLFHVFYYLAPNFSVMNVRDLASVAHAGRGWVAPAVGYGIAYTSVALCLVVILFRKKEF